MGLPKNLSMVVLALFMLGAAPAVTQAQALVKPPQDSAMQVVHSYQNDVSLPLYYLPAWTGKAGEGREGPENPKLPNNHVDSADPVVQHRLAPQLQMPASILNFDGILFPGVGCNCAPPDTNGRTRNRDLGVHPA